MEKYKGKTFADLESREIEYAGEKYKVWDIEVRPGETVLFADVRLLVAITDNRDEGGPTDEIVACFADPEEDVNELIEKHLHQQTHKGGTAMNIIPDNEFLTRLGELTEENNHGQVFCLIAEWCANVCPADTVEHKDHKAAFTMFKDIFTDMNAAHLAIGHFPFGHLRYEVAQEMNALIVKCFGAATLEAINKAC